MSLIQRMKLVAVCGVAGAAFAGSAVLAQGMGPGTIGYVQGQVALGGKPLLPSAEGRASLKAGEMLSTGSGRVEVALEPGVVLRLEPASVVKMVVAEPAKSEVMLVSGRAYVSVGNVEGKRDLQVDTANGVQTLLLEHGSYGFDAKAGVLKVYDGKAAVSENDNAKWTNVKGGHEIALDGSATKAVDFDEAGDRGGYGDGAYGPGYGFGGYGYGGLGYGGFGYGDGFYGPYAFGVYPGFYGGFYPGFYGGGFYGGGFYGGGFRGGFGGFRGGRR